MQDARKSVLQVTHHEHSRRARIGTDAVDDLPVLLQGLLGSLGTVPGADTSELYLLPDSGTDPKEMLVPGQLHDSPVKVETAGIGLRAAAAQLLLGPVQQGAQ